MTGKRIELATPDSGVSFADYCEARQRLGTLGDSRSPIELTQWRTEILPQAFANQRLYAGLMRRRVYDRRWVSCDQEQLELSATIALKRFWIARFLVTVAQFATFIEHGAVCAPGRTMVDEARLAVEASRARENAAYIVGTCKYSERPAAGRCQLV